MEFPRLLHLDGNGGGVGHSLAIYQKSCQCLAVGLLEGNPGKWENRSPFPRRSVILGIMLLVSPFLCPLKGGWDLYLNFGGGSELLRLIFLKSWFSTWQLPITYYGEDKAKSKLLMHPSKILFKSFERLEILAHIGLRIKKRNENTGSKHCGGLTISFNSELWTQ